MKHLSLTLYLEINNFNFIFFVRSNDDQNNFKTIFKLKTKLEGITNERISDIDKISDLIKSEGKTEVIINVADKNQNISFKLKNKRFVDRKSINIIRNNDIYTIIH